MKTSVFVWMLALTGAASVAAAGEDMDFVAEHLPEAAMDARLLSLPVTYADNLQREEWGAEVEALVARMESGHIRLSGPGIGAGLRRQLTRRWSLLGTGFFDRLDFSGRTEERALAPIFSPSFPISLPADATLTHQRGDLHQYGIGLAMRYQNEARPYVITFGSLLQHVNLQGYRVDYRLISGPDAGVAGTVDYSADYRFVTPFAAFEWRIARGEWRFSPRFLAGMPLPQRGWRGRIDGPGFQVAGDTASIGNGKHMGDPFAGFGFGVTYTPWHLTLDPGALLNQALVEPRIHKGVDRVWLMSFDWEL